MGKKQDLKSIGYELLKEETKNLYSLIESIKNPKKSLNLKIDYTTKLYCEGKISEDEFFKYLNGTLNEGFVDFIEKSKNWVKEKVLNVLYTLLQQSAKVGSKILSKVVSSIGYIFDKLNSFADKNPKVWRAIIIGVVLFVVFIFSVSSAKAATTGHPIDPNIINAAIGKIESIKGVDSMFINKAIAYLVDIRDGHQEISSELYGKKAIDFANHAINTIDTLKSTSEKTAGDDEKTAALNFISFIKDYMKAGANYVSAEVTKYGDDAAVRFIKK